MSNLVELTDIELLIRIRNCELEIQKLVTQPNLDYYPGAIMGLGDYYVEKYLLMNELLRRKLPTLFKSKWRYLTKDEI